MHQYRLREQLEHGDHARPWQLYTLTAHQGMVFPCHWHPEWELVVVERGGLELTREQTLWRLGEGDAVWLTATELHGATSCDSALRVAAFVFHPDLLRSLHGDAATSRWIDPLAAGTLSVAEPLASGSPAARGAQALVDAVRAGDAAVDLTVKGRLFQVLADAMTGGLVREGSSAASPDTSPAMRAVLQVIEESFADELSVAALADRAHLSPSHFTRVFRAFTGDTPMQYVIRRRIDEAHRLLRSGELTVTEAALQVGFTNFSHFTRTFKAHRGIVPSEALGPWAHSQMR